MDDSKKKIAYPSLRALDRVAMMLKIENISIPESVSDFLDDVWEWLVSDSIKLNTKILNRAIDKAVIDEQEADHQETIRNFFLFAVSDLLLYFTDANEESLYAIRDSIEELHYYAADHRVMESSQNSSDVYSDVVRSAINSDRELLEERRLVSVDSINSQSISDWPRVVQDRFKY